MTKNLRWRIMTLQAILVLVLGFAAGFLFYESNFVTKYIHDELVSQKISFPDKDTLTSAKNADGTPEYTNLVIQYAGQPVDNGDKAYAYANGFIGVHLETIAKDPVSGQVIKDPNGETMTYATMGDYINKQKAAGAPASTITALTNERTSMFTGEMLRGTLLNAWGWSQMATYTFYAGIVAAIGAIAVLGALVFELFFAKPAVFVAQQQRAA